jgi:hypothetical protein
MKHFKKLKLVDVTNDLNLIVSPAQSSSSQISKSHKASGFTEKQFMEAYLNKISHEMSKVLETETLNEREKMILYNKLLRRFLFELVRTRSDTKNFAENDRGSEHLKKKITRDSSSPQKSTLINNKETDDSSENINNVHSNKSFPNLDLDDNESMISDTSDITDMHDDPSTFSEQTEMSSEKLTANDEAMTKRTPTFLLGRENQRRRRNAMDPPVNNFIPKRIVKEENHRSPTSIASISNFSRIPSPAKVANQYPHRAKINNAKLQQGGGIAIFNNWCRLKLY